MGRFIENAKELQMMSITKEEAVKNYRASCRICTRRGFNIECDHCPVRATHEMVMSAFYDTEYAEKQKKLKKAEENLKKHIDIAQSCLENEQATLEDMEEILCVLACRLITLYEQKKEM